MIKKKLKNDNKKIEISASKTNWFLEPFRTMFQLWVCVLLMSNIVCVASLLLQISVNFKAVVSRVGHGHVSVWGEGQALGPIQGVGWCVDVGQEGARAVEHLTKTHTRKCLTWYNTRGHTMFHTIIIIIMDSKTCWKCKVNTKITNTWS